MKQRWTLNIEKFGKIEKAQIEISPLMLFVGDNNSGKSYLMSLLWGIVASGYTFLNYKTSSLKTYKKCAEWLQASIGKDTSLDGSVQQMFIDWFNDLLKQNKKELVNQVFNYPVELGNIYISDFKRSDNLKIIWHEEDKSTVSRDNIKLSLKVAETIEGRSKLLNYIVWKLIMDDISLPFPMQYFVNSRQPLYLPASRTGFMLTYKDLINNFIDSNFLFSFKDKQLKASHFTMPVTRFIQNLVGLQIKGGSKYSEIAGFIEKEILYGEISADESPIANYLYKTSQLKNGLPFHVTSSLVTELSPIILFLKSNINYNLMVIEEPEAHLHPQVQRIIARAIVRLVNKGLPVWITTHSDTIFQQINNLIKLNEHPNKNALTEKLGYEKEELLNPKNINAYQFNARNRSNTIVEKLKLTEYGFEVPTFNNAIIDLAKETILLGDTIEEDMIEDINELEGALND